MNSKMSLFITYMLLSCQSKQVSETRSVVSQSRSVLKIDMSRPDSNRSRFTINESQNLSTESVTEKQPKEDDEEVDHRERVDMAGNDGTYEYDAQGGIRLNFTIPTTITKPTRKPQDKKDNDVRYSCFGRGCGEHNPDGGHFGPNEAEQGVFDHDGERLNQPEDQKDPNELERYREFHPHFTGNMNNDKDKENWNEFIVATNRLHRTGSAVIKRSTEIQNEAKKDYLEGQGDRVISPDRQALQTFKMTTKA